MARVLKTRIWKIDRVKKRFVVDGLDVFFNGRKGGRMYTKKTDGDFEAQLVALSCSEPPEGFARWSLRLLADKVVELDYIDSISHKSIRRILKKNELKPWQNKGCMISPEQNGNLPNMEMVLNVYKRPYNARYPVVSWMSCPDN